MADRLVDFLTELDKNDKLKQEYLDDPKGTAEAYGLNEADVKICVENDFDAMKARAEAEGARDVSIGHTK